MPDQLRKIKKMRQKLGLTQAELAKEAKVSQSIITKIERGHIEPSYSIAKRILLTLEEKLAGSQQQISAKDVCSKKIIFVNAKDKISSALDLMIKNAISQMPVVNEKVIVGSISEEVFIRKYSKIKNKNMSIEEIMDDPFPIIPENTPLTLVKEMLNLYSAVIVTKNGKHIGIISKSDLLKIHPFY